MEDPFGLFGGVVKLGFSWELNFTCFCGFAATCSTARHLSIHLQHTKSIPRFSLNSGSPTRRPPKRKSRPIRARSPRSSSARARFFDRSNTTAIDSKLVSSWKMQASIKSGYGLQNRRLFLGVSDYGKKDSAFPVIETRLPMSKRTGCFGFRIGWASMGAKGSVESVFGSSTKFRSVRAQASEGDVEDAASAKIHVKSSGSVLPYVGVACLGAILFGYHLGVVNGALEYLAKDLGIAENAVLKGWVVSTLLAGATVGSFTGGSLADKFGRTKTFQLDAIPLTIGAFLCATAQSIEAMIIGRLLAGIGIGISSAIVPLYISEISPTEVRGTLGSVNQLFICVGILAALVAGLPLAGNPLWWRTMFGVALVPSMLLALGMTFSPESPRWLYQQGKISQAETSIRKLYGKERVVEVMSDLDAASQGSSEPEAGWFDLLSRRYRNVVSVGAALFLLQQLAGINAVVYYSTAVFRSAGVASDVAASALVGAANVFGTTIASSLMDKQGRKSLLLISFSGMAVSMLLLFLTFTWNALTSYSGTLAVLGTVLYVLSFSLGAGPVPALLLPEIFASRIRAKAVALSLGMHWISNFVIGLYFLSVVNKFGISTVYLGFACVCLLAVMYIAGNVVETKGRSLEEIELALSPAI
ncbi:plastidic glucose transporter 4-like isoform X3 [Primulina tabacum]|uniref:plastidic glucose transporter 4-like isoform X3 n=1 Tax=Primulina tabacum TaxID=48773 RepID=UPI003F5A032E